MTPFDQYPVVASNVYPGHARPGAPTTLTVGTYTVRYDIEAGYFLSQTDRASIPSKIYGNPRARVERIMNTWKDRNRNTGVLLSGEKGSGKSLLLTMLSDKAESEGISTLIVEQDFHGPAFNAFLQQLDIPAIVLFDEFEKVYNETEKQEGLLTLLDGVSRSNKLFLFSTNSRHLSNFLINRPGRIFYHLKYEHLDEQFIREYLQDVLKNQAYTDPIVVMGRSLVRFNFDMLKGLVEEMNRYDISPSEALEMVNITINTQREQYDIDMMYKGVKIAKDKMAYACSNGSINVSPFDSGFTIDFYTPGEEDAISEIYFSNEHIKKFDIQTGEITFDNGEGSQLKLTRSVAAYRQFNPMDAF